MLSKSGMSIAEGTRRNKMRYTFKYTACKMNTCKMSLCFLSLHLIN